MTRSGHKVPLYPKSHLLAASGVAALLSLALLVFPSREVEAKRTSFNLDLNDAATQASPMQPPLRSEVDNEEESQPSPFAQINEPESTETAQQLEEQETATEELATNPLERAIVVASGDTLSTLFAKVGLSSQDVHTVLDSGKGAKQFSRLNVGQTLNFTLTPEGKLATLSTQVSPLETIKLSLVNDRYSFESEQIKPNVHQRYARGVIDSSLFLAADRAGLPHSMTFDLANVFGYDIDFAMDIRKGDEFEVIYEDKLVEGKRVGTGQILAARFTNRGKTYTAVRYVDKQGGASYYTAQGESMRKAFIRTPVDFARISSRFSNGRKHPILNKIRAHKGVDYAAPRGTPIKAAGDGKVVLAGRKGGYGNTIVLQHGNRYRTLYAHMQGFAKGVKTGGSVKQGQVIGYIGTTGLSTGPHLHYEFQVNGVHVDPLSQKLPMADPIAGKEKQRFLQLSAPLMAKMDQERTTALAMNTETAPKL